MKEILLEHFHRYPQMQLQDAVKLLYQSEFGGGHMITSPEKSLKSLEDEWKGCKGRKPPVVCESIVWGVVSMVLYGIMGNAFSVKIFLSSALLKAVPGIVLQIVLIPVIIVALRKAKVIK